MVEESVADEIVLVPIVSAGEYQRQGPDRRRAIGMIERVRVLIYEGTRLVVPPAQVTAESSCCFVRQIDQDHFDTNFCRAADFIQIKPAVEIMFVDDRPSKKPLRSENEVKRLADGRLS